MNRMESKCDEKPSYSYFHLNFFPLLGSLHVGVRARRGHRALCSHHHFCLLKFRIRTRLHNNRYPVVTVTSKFVDIPNSITACQCLTRLLLCPLVVPITKVHQWQSTARMSCTYLRTRRFAAPRLPGDTLLTADCGLGFACPFPGKLSHQGHPIVSARVSSCIPHVLPLQKNSIC